MDAVRVRLLLVAELVFMGKEDRNCIPRHLVSLVKDFDCWNMYPWDEYMWVKFYQRTVNVAAKHREFHLVKKKQNPNYYPTYNLYGFPLSFKIWILETYPNSRKWWSKKDNVLPRALAWSNVAKFGKNDYNGLLGPDSNPKLELYATPLEQQTEWFKASIEYINGLVDLDMNVSEDDIGGDVSNNSFDLNENVVSGNGNNDVLLLEGGDGFVDSVCGDTNHEDKQDQQDKQPSLADVLHELRALRKEIALVKVDDARISKLERLLNDNFILSNDRSKGNHNAVNAGLTTSANHPLVRIYLYHVFVNDPMSNSSGPDIHLAEVVVACMDIDKGDGDGHIDIPTAIDNDVNLAKSISVNDPMSNSSGPDIHLAEVVVACMEHDKGDGDGHIDIPTAIDNDVNLAKSVSVNDPMSNSSGPDIHLAEVAVACMDIDKGDGDGHIDIPTAIDNDVNLAKYVSVNDPMSNSSGPDIHLAEVVVACMEHDKGDGDGHIDIPTAIDNDVNLAKSVSVNDPMSNSSGPDIHLAEVAVACMDIDKGDGDGHIDIPTAIDNDVNLAKSVSVNDLMPNDVYEGNVVSAKEGRLDVLIQVVCDGKGIDKADGYSQLDPSTLTALIEGFDSQNNNPGIDFLQRDCSVAKPNDHPTADIGVKPLLENEFDDDFMELLNDEESLPKVSLDDINVDEQEEKLIDTVKVESNKSEYINVVTDDYKPCLASVFAQHIDLWVDLMWCFRQPDADWAMVSPHFLPCTLGGNMIDCFSNGVRYPVAWRDVEKVYFPVNEPKRHWCLAELHITTGLVTFYDSLGWVSSNRRHWWRNMKRTLPQQLTLYLNEHGVLQSKGIAVERYEITYKFPTVIEQAGLYGDCGIWVCIFLYRLSRNLPLPVNEPLQTALAYRERILQYFWTHKIEAEKSLIFNQGTYQIIM
ncbi:phospholipase-like protein [Tanacetum coccineum]